MTNSNALSSAPSAQPSTLTTDKILIFLCQIGFQLMKCSSANKHESRVNTPSGMGPELSLMNTIQPPFTVMLTLPQLFLSPVLTDGWIQCPVCRHTHRSGGVGWRSPPLYSLTWTDMLFTCSVIPCESFMSPGLCFMFTFHCEHQSHTLFWCTFGSFVDAQTVLIPHWVNSQTTARKSSLKIY